MKHSRIPTPLGAARLLSPVWNAPRRVSWQNEKDVADYETSASPLPKAKRDGGCAAGSAPNGKENMKFPSARGYPDTLFARKKRDYQIHPRSCGSLLIFCQNATSSWLNKQGQVTFTTSLGFPWGVWYLSFRPFQGGSTTKIHYKRRSRVLSLKSYHVSNNIIIHNVLVFWKFFTNWTTAVYKSSGISKYSSPSMT